MANELEIIINKRSIRGIDTTTKQEYFSTFIDQVRWKRDENDNFSFYNSVPLINKGDNESLNKLGVTEVKFNEYTGKNYFTYDVTLNPDTGVVFVSADVMETWLGTNTGFYFDPNPVGVVLTIGVVHDATLTGSGTVIDPLSVVGGGQVDSVVAGTNITVDNTDPINPIISASGGGSGPTLRNVTATDTFATANETINCTANTFTVNLPTAVGIQGTTYTLVNSGTGVITLDGNGTETINGSLTIDLVQYVSRTVQSDNTNWIII